MTETMVERVARAIWDVSMIGSLNVEDPKFEEIGKNALCWRQARAAIEAMREPTEAMLAAGELYGTDAPGGTWRVMLSAALSPLSDEGKLE